MRPFRGAVMRDERYEGVAGKDRDIFGVPVFSAYYTMLAAFCEKISS